MNKLPLMHPLIETHRAELLALAHKRGITSLRVFGSMSRGDTGNIDEASDVDLLASRGSGLAFCLFRRT